MNNRFSHTSIEPLAFAIQVLSLRRWCPGFSRSVREESPKGYTPTMVLSSGPQIRIERAVVDCFAEVRFGDCDGTLDVSDRS